MLRISDDSAAEVFWNRSGGSAIISRVTARYGLASTTTPYNGRWYITLSTAGDLVRYYDKLLDGSGGLPQEQASVIMANLRAVDARRHGIDGYPQRFGIPDGLYAEPVAVKQGWFCCWNGGNWVHLSTGVIGLSVVTSWRSARCSPPATPPRANTSPRPSRRCSPAAASSSPANAANGARSCLATGYR